MNAPANCALIVGATGTAGRRLASLVAGTEGWRAFGLSRNPPATTSGSLGHVAADLFDAQSCRRTVQSLPPVTHLVYAARDVHGEDGREDVDANLAMLRHVVEACQGSSLRHVHILAGTKWYGLHLGPFRTPARESDPGHMPPNFYFDQQEYVAEAAAQGGWSWSASRPNIISDVMPGRGRNLLSTIAAYAAICGELGRPFHFPGKRGAYTSLQEMTDAQLLADGIFWMMRSEKAKNQAFNIVNGDLFRWANLWPRLADHFGLTMGEVRPFPLAEWMADKAPVWARIVTRHALVESCLERVAAWDFADFLLSWDFDLISSMSKARAAGFSGYVDTEEMIFGQLAEYRAARLVP